MRCRVCQRPIRSEKSIAAGMGPRCWEHRHILDQPGLFDGATTDERPESVGATEEMQEIVDFDKIRR